MLFVKNPSIYLAAFPDNLYIIVRNLIILLLFQFVGDGIFYHTINKQIHIIIKSNTIMECHWNEVRQNFAHKRYLL